MSAEPSSSELSAQRRKVWLGVGALSVLAIAVAAAGGLIATDQNADATEQKREQSAPVRAAGAHLGDLTLRAEYTGELVAEMAELSSQVVGRLEAVQVRIGDRVKAGELLARIDASMARHQLAEAQAQIRAADATLTHAESDLQSATVELGRGETLGASRFISQKELDALRTEKLGLEADVAKAKAQRAQAKAQVGVLGQTVRETRIVAPFDGAVAERFLDPGALMQPGTKILRLVRSGPLRVRFRVPERDLGRVAVEMALEATTQATRDRRFPGVVTRIAAEVSATDRAAVVEGQLTGEPPELRPGMYARVVLVLGELKDVLLLPSVAVVEQAREGRAPVVGAFTVEAGRARFHPLSPLGEADGLTAVRGLRPDAQVITLGHENLRDGDRVRIAQEPAP